MKLQIYVPPMLRVGKYFVLDLECNMGHLLKTLHEINNYHLNSWYQVVLQIFTLDNSWDPDMWDRLSLNIYGPFPRGQMQIASIALSSWITTLKNNNNKHWNSNWGSNLVKYMVFWHTVGPASIKLWISWININCNC